MIEKREEEIAFGAFARKQENAVIVCVVCCTYGGMKKIVEYAADTAETVTDRVDKIINWILVWAAGQTE